MTCHHTDSPPAARPAAKRRAAVRLATGAALTLLLSSLSVSGASAHGGDPLLMVPVHDQITVTTRDVPGVGRVLTDDQGHALYMFLLDVHHKVSCTGACAGTWPPLAITPGHHPTAEGGVQSRLLGTTPDPNTGAMDVTYDGYPLYLYVNDTGSGTANGQDLESDGGPWFVLRPSGQPIHHPMPQAGSK